MILVQLFYEFFLTGLFSVGGGLATLPFLYDMAERTQWFSPGDVADMLAISESTPGAIGVNMSTYVGFETAGLVGSIVATTALVLPSVIIILLIAYFLGKFQENKFVGSSFYGLRAASVALVAAAGLGVCKIAFVTPEGDGGLLHVKAVVLAVALWYMVERYKKHPVVYILGAAVIGVVFKFGS